MAMDCWPRIRPLPRNYLVITSLRNEDFGVHTDGQRARLDDTSRQIGQSA
ncbi:MAG: hypothetical protein AVDCRST_MAG70-684 [uncultured Thermomicrobiales bacterium]|uniref:Uncharacterized protein n=1 Tax=uncultured Thermomicrobiales bacterium TaxID=1645740 RepID=A0A6J4UEH6_9BACT|nr:MAG: hypothetical protein AVDCRST_MAG70-684 [uncultured Thermomicrobiales bacterium]